MNLFSQKITPLLVAGIVVVLLSMITAVTSSRRDSSGLELGALAAILLVTLVVVALDRLAVLFLPLGLLSLIELVLLLGGIGWYAYDTRSTVIDCSNNPSDYLVIVQTNDQPESPLFQNRFPFSRLAVVSQGQVILVNTGTFSATTVNTPKHWKSTYSRGIALHHPRFVSAYFYGPDHYINRPAEVDSLVKQAVGL